MLTTAEKQLDNIHVRLDRQWSFAMIGRADRAVLDVWVADQVKSIHRLTCSDTYDVARLSYSIVILRASDRW
jgi:hypothetical protein